MAYLIKRLWKDVHLAMFDTQIEMNKTMIRFQEYYESPEFRGKIFTLKEYRDWYIKNGRNPGKFTYYTDWNGCNLPVSFIYDFITDNNLSKREKCFISTMFDKSISVMDYVICTHRQFKESNDIVILHELAHALFRNKRYAKKVDCMMRGSADVIETWDYVKSLKYHKDVFLDELQAYMISGHKGGKSTKLQDQMRKYFETKINIKELGLKW
jgi:hypothetical protein